MTCLGPEYNATRLGGGYCTLFFGYSFAQCMLLIYSEILERLKKKKSGGGQSKKENTRTQLQLHKGQKQAGLSLSQVAKPLGSGHSVTFLTPSPLEPALFLPFTRL